MFKIQLITGLIFSPCDKPSYDNNGYTTISGHIEHPQYGLIEVKSFSFNTKDVVAMWTEIASELDCGDLIN